jgi:hypothetical protein
MCHHLPNWDCYSIHSSSLGLATLTKLFTTSYTTTNWFSSVWTKFTAVLKFCAFPELRTRLVVQFCKTFKFWTKLWSSLGKFRFKLWFRTKLRQPYILKADHTTPCHTPYHTLMHDTTTFPALNHPHISHTLLVSHYCIYCLCLDT